MKSYFSLLVSFFVLSSAFCQEETSYLMPNDTTIFHKMISYQDHLWALDYGNGHVFKSENSGKDWSVIYRSEGEYLEAVQFLNKKVGFICGDFGIVIKTEDGGNTWKDISPQYSPRITKEEPMEDDSVALKRYYYQMYFKTENDGLLWGFEKNPISGWRDMKRFYYSTVDGGDSWKRWDYNRENKDSIVHSFLNDAKVANGQTAMNIYYQEGKTYELLNNEIKISSPIFEEDAVYPLPAIENRRCMMRYITMLNVHQGYIFGGDFNEPSGACILETLDGGKSWKELESDMSHIHSAIHYEDQIFISGKEGLLKKWKPEMKGQSSVIHDGNTSQIMIDGKAGSKEWSGANRLSINEGIDIYAIQDEHYYYFSVKYDTTRYKDYYVDFFFDIGQDSTLNLHASQQLGERILVGNEWTDSEPAFDWGFTDRWTGSVMKYSRTHKMYVPTNATEFQIAKDKFNSSILRIAIQTRDINWEKEIEVFPKNADLKNPETWFTFDLHQK